MAKDLIPPEYLLGHLYGRTATELGMPNRRREELIVAAMVASVYNDECDTAFQIPSRYLAPTDREDADGIDVRLKEERGQSLPLQIKGVHIKRAIARKRAGIERAVETALGDAALRRSKEDSAQLAEALQPVLEKLEHFDYSDAVVVLHVQAETASQTTLQRCLQLLAARIEQLRAREVWFLQAVPITLPEGTVAHCRVYQLLRARPDPAWFAYHFVAETPTATFNLDDPAD